MVAFLGRGLFGLAGEVLEEMGLLRIQQEIEVSRSFIRIIEHLYPYRFSLFIYYDSLTAYRLTSWQASY